jgi:uncharacterized membrane protein
MNVAGGGGLLERERIEQLELQVRELHGRVRALEGRERSIEKAAPERFSGGTAARPQRRGQAERTAPERLSTTAAAAPLRPASQPRPATRSVVSPPVPVWGTLSLSGVAERLGAPARESMEDVLGGRVLAWVGGLAVLLGVVFLFAMAASRGWIGEGARVALGALASTGLIAAGIWLHEHKGRTDAALAALATGVSAMFVTITVAAQVYELVPDLVAIAMAVATGAVATALAVRWESRGIGALGILGALVAPVLAGADPEGASIAILFVALASAAGVLLRQRWEWLALAAFAVSVPQWGVYLFDDAGPVAAIVTLTVFGGLGIALAVGHEIRARAESIRSSSAFLLALNALIVAGAGWLALETMGEPGIGKGWLVAVAAAHVALGLAAPRLARVSHDLGLLSLVLGVLLGNVAFGLIADGVVLTAGWSASAVGFAALARRRSGHARDAALLDAGLGGHIALALIHTLAVDAPVADAADGGTLSAAGAAGIVVLSAACLVSGRMANRFAWRATLDALGLAALAYLTGLALDGPTLAFAWIGEAVALLALAHRTRDRVAGWASLGFLALAAVHVLAVVATPVSLVTGLADPLDAVIALGAVAAAAIAAASALETLHPKQRPALLGAAGVTLLYLASGLVVTPFESADAVDSTLLSAHQQGQMVLSVFWALVGVGVLVTGLQRDLHALRVAGLALLGVTATKVFLFDLATLSSLYRVVSFIGLGLLLLAGAFVWQRLRPRNLPDMREVPEGIR